MSDSKYSENDPERTLITLDQLSQTIEVMTSVVNRLRQHLSQQISARNEQAQREVEEIQESLKARSRKAGKKRRDGFVVELSQSDQELENNDDKTIH